MYKIKEKHKKSTVYIRTSGGNQRKIDLANPTKEQIEIVAKLYPEYVDKVEKEEKKAKLD